MRTRGAVAAVSALLAVAAVVVALPAAGLAGVTHYPLPNPNSEPLSITVGPDGALWFTESAGRIGRITNDGAVSEYALPGFAWPGGITAGPDGALWFTELLGNKIGRITPSGQISEYSLALPTRPWDIAAGSDGALWFTSDERGVIGRITTDGQIREYPIPNGTPNAQGNIEIATSIVAGQDGALWFTVASSPPKLGRISTDGQVREFEVSAFPSAWGPDGLAVASDGALWYTSFQLPNLIGKMTTAGLATTYPLIQGTGPAAIAAGPDGGAWFTELNHPFLGSITRDGVLVEHEVPDASGLSGITVGPDDAVWFTEWFGNRIGRLTPNGTPPVLTLPPDITIDATSPSGAVVAYTATAHDEDDPNVAVTCTPPSGSMFPIGLTRVICTATDAAGNTVSGSFAVKVLGGAQLHHVAIEFVTNWREVVTRWEGGVASGTAMAMANDGTLEWLAADAAYGDPAVTLTADLRSRHIARLMTGSLTATRGNARIQFRDVIAPFSVAADGTVTNPIPIPASYYDGVHMVFGRVSLRFSDG